MWRNGAILTDALFARLDTDLSLIWFVVLGMSWNRRNWGLYCGVQVAYIILYYSYVPVTMWTCFRFDSIGYSDSFHSIGYSDSFHSIARFDGYMIDP